MKSYEDVAMVPYDQRLAVYQSLGGARSEVTFLLKSYDLYSEYFPETNGYKQKIDHVKDVLNPSGDTVQEGNPAFYRAQAFGEGAAFALGLRFYISDLGIPYYNEPADHLLRTQFADIDETQSILNFVNTGFTVCSQSTYLREILERYTAQRDDVINHPSASFNAMVLAGAGCVDLMLDFASQAEDTSLSAQNAEMFDTVSNDERRFQIEALQDLYDVS